MQLSKTQKRKERKEQMELRAGEKYILKNSKNPFFEGKTFEVTECKPWGAIGIVHEAYWGIRASDGQVYYRAEFCELGKIE